MRIIALAFALAASIASAAKAAEPMTVFDAQRCTNIAHTFSELADSQNRAARSTADVAISLRGTYGRLSPTEARTVRGLAIREAADAYDRSTSIHMATRDALRRARDEWIRCGQ
jgi:hypothetical protein